MKVVTLLVINLLSLYSFASSEIRNKSLNFSAGNDYENRLDEQEQEIKRLIGKIEILEHKVNSLNKEQSNTLNQNLEEVATQNNEAPDIFDISALDSINHTKTTPPSAKPDSDFKQVTSDKQAYDLALASFKDGKFTESEKKFAEFIQKYPNNSMISNAYFWYAESFFKRKDFNKAAINYLKCYKESPKGAKASDGLLKLALSLGELKKPQEACNILVKLDSEFPTNRTAISKKTAEDAKIKFGCKNKSK